MRAIEFIRRANQPGIPEDSVRLRVACLGTVLVAIATCASMAEVSWRAALVAMALVSLGMLFSYVTRTHPPAWVKILVALGATAAFGWFFHTVSAPAGNITSVINPLTVLLASVLAVHSFHVPARRDLLFSLGASAGLMAVGATEAIDLRFGLFVVAWIGLTLWSLTEMWASASGGGRVSFPGLVTGLLAMTAMSIAIFLVLPAPTVATRFSFLAKTGAGGSIGVPGELAGDGASPTEPSRAGTPSGPTRVGGYLGFADSLNTALRGTLGNSEVMLVRAQRPTFWVGETFNEWDGENWTATLNASHAFDEQSPFVLPVPEGDIPLGQADLQTFYVTSSTADLVFHAERADQLWFPTSSVFFSADGTIVSPIGLGKGAIYTVESQVDSPTPGQLRSSSGQISLPPATEQAYVQLPHPYLRARALARSVTARDTNTYDKVRSLIGWIGAHTHYATDIPPLPAGADTVDEFLFGNRVGFCEQISTSLAVMLRTLGIPAREAVGYVPGSYNPITDLYEVRANDAHAWVQVWFPGYGWQSFDPTAAVLAANPAPGATALADLGHAVGHVPLIPLAAVVAASLAATRALRWRRRRPATWAERVAWRVERAGQRAGYPRRPCDTFGEYATTLDDLRGDGTALWRDVASVLEATAYGGQQPSADARHQIATLTRHTRLPRKDRANHPPRHPS
jgi:transglutaminase-like putative cysteine protease